MPDARVNDSGQSREAGIGRTVIADLTRGGLQHTVRRDLEDLYAFYLDEGSRDRLRRMNALRRWLSVAGWLLKSLILRLSPARRLLVLISLLLVAQERMPFGVMDGVSLRAVLGPVGYLILFVVLMLELKDKLLARDEIQVGRAVQLALLPRQNPVLEGWDVWMFTRPANDVGGDLVDYLALGEDRLGLALGDVAGKGLGAALLMAKLQATLRACVTDGESMGELGRRLNGILYRDSVPERFATLVYLEIARGSSRVRLLNAGHLLPVIVRREGQDSPPPVAPPLGVMPGSTFTEQAVDLQPGDLLVAFSDGVTEARNRAGEFLGEGEFAASFGPLRGLSAEAAGLRILDDVDRFVGNEPPADDLSLILIRRVAV